MSTRSQRALPSKVTGPRKRADGKGISGIYSRRQHRDNCGWRCEWSDFREP